MLFKVLFASSAHMRLTPNCRNRIQHALDPYTEFKAQNMGKLIQLYWKNEMSRFQLDWVSLSAIFIILYLQVSCFFIDVYILWRKLSDCEAFIVYILYYGYQSQDYIACLIL